MDELVLTEEYRLGTFESSVVTLDPAADYTGEVTAQAVMTDAEAGDTTKTITHVVIRAQYPGSPDWVALGSMESWKGGPPGPKGVVKPSVSTGFTPGNKPSKLKIEVGFGSGGVSLKSGFRLLVPTVTA